MGVNHMSQVTLEVKGMTCGHCKAAVEGALKELSGVSTVDVDLSSGKVDVNYEDTRVSMNEMQEAVEDQGYDIVK